MKSPKRNWMIYGALLAGVAGVSLWFLGREDELAAPGQRAEFSVEKSVREFSPALERPVETLVPAAEELEPFEWPEGVVPNELVMSFRTRSELEAFLRDARRAGLETEVIPALNLVRVRVRDDEQARRATELAGGAGVSLNPVVAAPDVPELDGIAAAFLPFGDQALGWMGVPENNANWGEGIRIAILDTGVADHPLLANASITHASVLDGGAQKEGVGSHGTSVASLIAGQGDIRGIAPGADLLSIQVLDGNGVGDGFQLAMGIIQAVDSGANIINLSLGTTTASSFLWDAVQYAQQRDVTLVASAGNDGGGQLLYPAAYDGVFAVGSIDGNGQHLPFSNRGDGLGVTAPGFGLYAAGADGSVVQLNGTSFSAPLAAGALAYLQQTMRPGEAVRVLQDYANDAGPPGRDGIYGHGIIDMERVEWRNVPWLHDVAVADHVLDLSGDVPQMLVTVENRGTARTGNIFLEVRIGDQEYRMPMESLGAGEVGFESIPIDEFLRRGEEIGIISRVHVPGMDDVRPDNDIKAGQIRIRLPDPE